MEKRSGTAAVMFYYVTRQPPSNARVLHSSGRERDVNNPKHFDSGIQWISSRTIQYVFWPLKLTWKYTILCHRLKREMKKCASTMKYQIGLTEFIAMIEGKQSVLGDQILEPSKAGQLTILSAVKNLQWGLTKIIYIYTCVRFFKRIFILLAGVTNESEKAKSSETGVGGQARYGDRERGANETSCRNDARSFHTPSGLQRRRRTADEHRQRESGWCQ